MKKLFFILIVFFIVNSASAQYFEISFHDTVGQIDPQTHGLTLAGYLKNVSNDTLDFKMIRLQNNLPSASWSSSICLGLCAPSFVDTMSTRDFNMALPPGDSIVTDVIFEQTDSIPGIATVQIKYATLDESQIEIQWFEAYTILNNIKNKSTIIVNEFKVLENYPNPFNNQTNITALIGKASKVTLEIFDILGRQIYKSQKDISSPGTVAFRWNGITNKGVELSSGVYFYKITTNSNGNINQSQIKKMTLLR
jgi:hypothetical protein